MSRASSIAKSPALNALVPPGVYMPFGGSTAPTGWLSCDGAAVSRTTYASLFAAIGTTYGTGDGSTTFNVPNMGDRIAVGKSGTRTLGATGGASNVTPSGSVANTTLTEAQMPSHYHNTGTGHQFYGGTGGMGFTNGGTYSGPNTYGPNTDWRGSNNAHNHGMSISQISVEQPWTCCHYIIKY
jgi:microcystin-dependent protein